MINAADYIKTGHDNAMTREELVSLTGLTDREVRKDIQYASAHGDLIINMQDGKGYFRPSPIKDDAIVRNWIMLMQSRIKEEERKLHIAERFING